MKAKAEEILMILEEEIITEIDRLFFEHAQRGRTEDEIWFTDRLGAVTLHCMLDLVRTRDIAEWERRMDLVENGKSEQWVNEPWASLESKS